MDAINKIPNVELFREKTSSTYWRVKLKDPASFFSVFLRSPYIGNICRREVVID
jgi:hypothetical protein